MKHTQTEKLFRIDCGEIYLQEFSAEDADAIFRISSQPEVSAFLPDWKSTKEQRVHWVTEYEVPANKAFLEAVAAGADIDGHILKLGIFLKETDEFIGWCCTGIKEELAAPNREIMYAIGREHQQKGYATKACTGLMRYLFEKTALETLNAVALTNNIASNRVIEKCGFVQQGQQMIDGELYNHYVLTRTLWTNS